MKYVWQAIDAVKKGVDAVWNSDFMNSAVEYLDQMSKFSEEEREIAGQLILDINKLKNIDDGRKQELQKGLEINIERHGIETVQAEIKSLISQDQVISNLKERKEAAESKYMLDLLNREVDGVIMTTKEFLASKRRVEDQEQGVKSPEPDSPRSVTSLVTEDSPDSSLSLDSSRPVASSVDMDSLVTVEEEKSKPGSLSTIPARIEEQVKDLNISEAMTIETGETSQTSKSPVAISGLRHRSKSKGVGE